MILYDFSTSYFVPRLGTTIHEKGRTQLGIETPIQTGTQLPIDSITEPFI